VLELAPQVLASAQVRCSLCYAAGPGPNQLMPAMIPSWRRLPCRRLFVRREGIEPPTRWLGVA
jgi:hypothetical protein